MGTGRIYRNKEEEHIYHDLLKDHFSSVETYEKYPDAAFNLLLTAVCDKVLGKNFRKERISQRKSKKINKIVKEKLNKKYGPWITFTNFRIKKDLTIQYRTNLHRIFRVKGRGILYGAEFHDVTGNIFFTSHSIQRFEERADQNYTLPFGGVLKNVFKTEPTSYDLLNYLIRTSNMQYGRIDNYCYLNTVVGYLVLEDLGDVFIAKTFYSNDMKKGDIKWYEADADPENATSFADILNSPALPIDEPIFIQDEFKALMGIKLEELIEKIKSLKEEEEE